MAFHSSTSAKEHLQLNSVILKQQATHRTEYAHVETCGNAELSMWRARDTEACGGRMQYFTERKTLQLQTLLNFSTGCKRRINMTSRSGLRVEFRKNKSRELLTEWELIWLKNFYNNF